MANEPWPSESGMSGGTSGVATPFAVGGTHVGTDGGHCALAENEVDCMPPGRPRNRASPCVAFVPDLVTTLIAALAVHPNSAENARDMMFISCTALTGIVENIVWRPH